MQKVNILALIKDKMGTIILAGVFLAAISFLFIVVSQKNFKVTSDFLIVQDKDGAQDYYSASKSAEYISKIFGEAIYSDLFIQEAIKTGKINNEFLPFDKKERLKEWAKIVKVRRNPEVSMMSVSVYDNNRDNAVRISEAITNVLTTKSYLFRGSGVNFDVRVLSGPIVEKNPSLENILLVIMGGFIIGVLIALTIIFYQPKIKNTSFIVDNNKFVGYHKISESSEDKYREPSEEEYKESLKYLNGQF